MQIGIFGTGMVGRVLSAALVAKGHAVMLGTRDPRATAVRREPDRYTGESFADWTAAHPTVRLGTYADAAAFGGLVMNATSGHGSLPAVQAAGSALDGKILIDIYLVLRGRFDLLGDLRVENPRLGIERGVLVDGQRTPPCDLLHDVHTQIETLELRGQIEAQRGLAHPVGTHERDLELMTPEGIGGEQERGAGHPCIVTAPCAGGHPLPIARPPRI